MGSREYWTIGMSSLGAISATQGEVTTLPDILLGAALWGGITYVIASVFKSQESKKTKSVGITMNSQVDANYDDTELPNDVKEFLKSLEIVKNRLDGWYRDPSNLFRLRYFQKGRWTLAVSDSESETEKSEAISKFLEPTSTIATTVSQPATIPANANMTSPPHSSTTPTPVNQTIEQLERIVELRQNDVISQQEFEKLKSEILGNH
jgi:hypothetical protein